LSRQLLVKGVKILQGGNFNVYQACNRQHAAVHTSADGLPCPPGCELFFNSPATPEEVKLGEFLMLRLIADRFLLVQPRRHLSAAEYTFVVQATAEMCRKQGMAPFMVVLPLDAHQRGAASLSALDRLREASAEYDSVYVSASEQTAAEDGTLAAVNSPGTPLHSVLLQMQGQSACSARRPTAGSLAAHLLGYAQEIFPSWHPGQQQMPESFRGHALMACLALVNRQLTQRRLGMRATYVPDLSTTTCQEFLQNEAVPLALHDAIHGQQASGCSGAHPSPPTPGFTPLLRQRPAGSQQSTSSSGPAFTTIHNGDLLWRGDSLRLGSPAMQWADPALALVCAASFMKPVVRNLHVFPAITEPALILSGHGAVTPLHVEDLGLASANTLYLGLKLWEIRGSKLYDDEDMELQFLDPITVSPEFSMGGLFGKSLAFLPTAELDTKLVLQQKGATVITLAGE
jgi:hypothetical protein